MRNKNRRKDTNDGSKEGSRENSIVLRTNSRDKKDNGKRCNYCIGKRDGKV